MQNGTRAPGPPPPPRRRGLEYNFDNKVLFKNNRPTAFQLFLKLTKLQTVEKTISLLFPNNTFLLKYSSKAVHRKERPQNPGPTPHPPHPAATLNPHPTEKIAEAHTNNQVRRTNQPSLTVYTTFPV